MPRTATIVPLHHIPSTLEPATVNGPCDPDGFVQICRADDSADGYARMAIYPRPPVAAGDEVLTLTDDRGQTYIVGILACKREDPDTASGIRLADGAVARLEGTPDKESLKLYSSENELLIDYQSDTGNVIVHAPSGNLEFSAEQGSIGFHSAKDIRIDGHRVDLNARHNLHLGVQDPS